MGYLVFFLSQNHINRLIQNDTLIIQMATSQNHFEGSYKDYSVVVDSPNDAIVIIQATDNKTKEKFNRTIDQRYLTQRQFRCLPDPYAVFDFLSLHWSQVQVQDATIFFKIKWNGGKKQQKIYIDLRPEPNSQVQPLKLQAKAWLDEIEKIKNECKTHSNELQLNKKRVSLFQTRQNIIYHKPNNVDISKFELVHLAYNCSRLKCIKTEQTYQTFINGFEILLGTRTQYRIKMLSSNPSHIKVGFCTGTVTGQTADNYTINEAHYFGFDGYIFDKQTQTSKNRVSCPIKALEIGVDLSSSEIYFDVLTVNFVHCGYTMGTSLSSQMKGKSLFMSILMASPGDEVEIWTN